MLAAKVNSGVAAPIVVSGRLWGATSISNSGDLGAFPPGVEERLEKFTSLVAVALANAEAREQLTASRARIVQAGDAERRRLERNLHDGAQQRLVSLALHLRIAESRLAEDPAAAAELIAEACDELALGLEELRELARGIHPAILTDHGLTPAVEALAARATMPVEVSGLPPERLAEPIEAAAFYVVSESLANVAKYASASQSPGRPRPRRRPARGRSLGRRRRRGGRRQGIGPARTGRPGGSARRPAYVCRASRVTARPCAPSSRCRRALVLLEQPGGLAAPQQAQRRARRGSRRSTNGPTTTSA